jgi:hypothetical protein
LPKYHIKILLGDFDAKLGREEILKQTIGNDSLHQVSNEECDGMIKINLVVKSNMF